MGVGAWFDRHSAHLGWAVTGLVIGAVVGWWAGSFTACVAGPACEVRVGSIEAAGTWVGGLGTVAAVLAAVAALRLDRETREAEARLASLTARQRELHLTADANRLLIQWQVNHWQGQRLLGAVLSVTNRSDETPIYRVQATSPLGAPLRARLLKPGATEQVDVDLRNRKGPVPDLADKSAFETEQLAQVLVYFKMNGRYWRKGGLDAQAELIEDEEMPD